MIYFIHQVDENLVNKYIIHIEIHFVGYLFIMNLINAWKFEHIKITS